MSTNKLIAEARSYLSPKSVAYVQVPSADMFAAVVDALETAAIQLKRMEKVTAQRKELAAVVHYLRLLTDGSDWNGGQVDDILDAAPSVALDRVKAEALREAADYLDSFEGPGGRQSAHDRAGRDIIRLIRDRADHIETEGDR